MFPVWTMPLNSSKMLVGSARCQGNLPQPPSLSLVRPINKNTINWVFYKQQKCISHSSGGWQS